MSDQTGIAWTGATWNPIRGCSRVSEGCRNCYAEKVAARFSRPGLPYEGLVTKGKWNGTIRAVTESLTVPLRWQRPRRIFVNSMSDLFHEDVSDETIDRIFAVMALADRHTFQVLTKRPVRMRAYLRDPGAEMRQQEAVGRILGSWRRVMTDSAAILRRVDPWVPLPNVWLGVSVEDQATADARIPLLLQTPAAVRFISAEPLLGPIDLRYVPWPADRPRFPSTDDISDGRNPLRVVEGTRLDWVIVGGESGPGARPCDVAWIRSIVGQCRQAGVACFVKQLGANPTGGAGYNDPPEDWKPFDITDRKGADPAEWPDDLCVQEFPAVRS